MTHLDDPNATSIESTNIPSIHPSSSRPQTVPPHIRIRNRRKRYLEAHPSYFGPTLESADPLLYDRLIRTHQTESERTQERTSKGFAGTLEADLLRSEAKLDEIKARQSSDPRQHMSTSTTSPATEQSNSPVKPRTTRDLPDGIHNDESSSNSNGNGSNNSILAPLPNPTHGFTTLNRDEARQYWTEVMTRRFLAGEDMDFDYGVVDGNEAWDDVRGEERDLEEDWFDGEEEEFVGGGSEVEDNEEEGQRLVGETGVQDF